jgi:UrcA family protein
MPKYPFLKLVLPGKLALPVAFGFALAASSVAAQGYGPEQVQVTAPHFRAQSTPLNGPLERVSLSVPVRYDDLDLRTYSGARALRVRVRDAAWQVCGRLAQAYPVRQMPGTSCYRTALHNALLRADEAVNTARDYRYIGYYGE